MKERVIGIIALLFMMLFTYAAVSKLVDVQTFAAQMSKSPLLTNYATVLAWAIPIGELVIVGLLMSTWRIYGLLASFTLMAGFTAYIIAILQLERKDIPCSCGGILNEMGWTEHLVFNTVFVLLGFVAVLLSSTTKKNKMDKTDSSPNQVSGELANVR